MRSRQRSICGLAAEVLTVLACVVLPLTAQQMSGDRARSPIVVELSTKKRVVYPGEMIKLRVTIKNQGNESLFIPRDISAINQRFILFLQHGSKTEWPNSVVAGDYFFAPGQPFASLLSRYWIALEPGMFYGCNIDVYSVEFPRLRAREKYEIEGRYSSHGFRENLRTFEEDTAKLPFKAWEGDVDTNAVWITVTKAAK